MSTDNPFTVAVAQATPVFLNRVATIEKACDLIGAAGRMGARLIAFPESFVPAYPDWVWAVPAGDEGTLDDLYAEFLDQSVTIPSDTADRLCRTQLEAWQRAGGRRKWRDLHRLAQAGRLKRVQQFSI